MIRSVLGEKLPMRMPCWRRMASADQSAFIANFLPGNQKKQVVNFSKPTLPYGKDGGTPLANDRADPFKGATNGAQEDIGGDLNYDTTTWFCGYIAEFLLADKGKSSGGGGSRIRTPHTPEVNLDRQNYSGVTNSTLSNLRFCLPTPGYCKAEVTSTQLGHGLVEALRVTFGFRASPRHIDDIRYRKRPREIRALLPDFDNGPHMANGPANRMSLPGACHRISELSAAVIWASCLRSLLNLRHLGFLHHTEAVSE